MINIDLEHLLIRPGFLDIKYRYIAQKTIKSLHEKYNHWTLDFLDVDNNPDIKRIENFVENKKNKYKDIVVLWIWWSALWTRAIFQAIKWKYYNSLSKEKRKWNPRLHILDNVDPIEINQILEILNLEKTLFLVISKSGSTLETISQYHFFKKLILKEKLLDYKKHFVVIAWEDSRFKEISLADDLEVFDIPTNIWWRFSALTNVWLVPLAFVWINIKELLTWVAEIKDELLNDNLFENKALLTSIIQYHSYIELGKNITVFFPYVSNFWILWQWYKQMVWESLGKWWIWVTLSDSVWVTDQHSQLQLYYDGPNDKLVIFLELEDFWVDYQIIWNEKFTFQNLMHTEKYGTEQSLSNYNKINYTLKLKKLDEKNLWALIVFFEMQTAILWELYWFNAFDQPGVEIWKKITHQKLEENIWKIELLENL